MKIYLDSDKVLHINDDVYMQETPLVFSFKGGKKFDIQMAGSDLTVLGRVYDLDVESIIDANGNIYATPQAVYDALKPAWITGQLTDSQLRASEIYVANKDAIGAYGDKVNPAGVAKFLAPNGYYFFACNCRIDGSKIASLEKSVNGVLSADATDSYIGVAMYQGEYHPFVNKIVSVTLTGATDQLQYWLKPL